MNKDVEMVKQQLGLQISKLKHSVWELQQELDKYKCENTDLKDEIKHWEKSYNIIVKENAKMEAKLIRRNGRILELEEQLKEKVYVKFKKDI